MTMRRCAIAHQPARVDRECAISCVVCTEPKDCQRRAAERTVDLAIISYRFDARSGFAFLKGLRAADAELPIVILTARGDEHITAEIIRAGPPTICQRRSQRAAGPPAHRGNHAAARPAQGTPPRETILRLNEQNYRTSSTTSPTSFSCTRGENPVYQPGGRINPGYSESEVIGRPIFDFIPEEQHRQG